MTLAASSPNNLIQAPRKQRHYFLGHILLEAGLVNADQLQCALDEQEEEAKKGKHVLLGKILVSWGLTSQVEIDELIEKLSRRNELIRFGTAQHKSVISNSKRLLDIVGALVGLGLTALALPWIALAIYCEDRGPVFFKQNRVGLRGYQFTIWKFRSMVLDADTLKLSVKSENKLFFSPKDDPRITRVGRILRKTMLDEFPQFWNVLMGDMSLVGTRPPTLDEVRHYEPHHYRRLRVKPGLTGLWQASGDRHAKDFGDVLALDLEYQKRWSLNLDVVILFKTVYGALVRSKKM
ncbi:MAG: sugar transferase [Anaerolineae bacterium]|nr:sugar transferase [Gloeobacterales cyanobacterium ES-bin-313]